jgi:hypothetical protein
MNKMDWPLLEERVPLESVDVAGVKVGPGSRVRLHPHQGGDIFDLALRGLIALVERLEEDCEGRRHVAVVIEDDPERDLGMLREPGYRFFFSPEEIEPLPGAVAKMTAAKKTAAKEEAAHKKRNERP